MGDYHGVGDYLLVMGDYHHRPIWPDALICLTWHLIKPYHNDDQGEDWYDDETSYQDTQWWCNIIWRHPMTMTRRGLLKAEGLRWLSACNWLHYITTCNALHYDDDDEERGMRGSGRVETSYHIKTPPKLTTTMMRREMRGSGRVEVPTRVNPKVSRQTIHHPHLRQPSSSSSSSSTSLSLSSLSSK